MSSSTATPSTAAASETAPSVFSSLVVPLQPASTESPRDADPFIDPAPFVGTRQASAEVPVVPTVSEEVSRDVVAAILPSTDGDRSSLEADSAVAALNVAYRASASMNAVTDLAPSHPLVRTLHDLASRIERRELEVRGYEAGMTPETSLAVLLAELLKRTR